MLLKRPCGKDTFEQGKRKGFWEEVTFGAKTSTMRRSQPYQELEKDPLQKKEQAEKP